jgi:transposase
MSLQWSLSQEVPESTISAKTVGTLLEEDDLYLYIGNHFNELLPDESVFEPMYCETGRGAVPPQLLFLVTIFQFLEKVPDRMAAKLIASRLDWKYACHLPLDYPGFHFTVLHGFRDRLKENDQDRALFEEIVGKLVDLGLIKRRGKMRTDSSHVLGVVQRLTQLELVIETLRVAMKAIQEVAPDWMKGNVPDVFVEAYDERFWEFKLSDAEVEERLSKAAHDASWFLRAVEAMAPEVVQALAEIKVLREVLDQQLPKGPDGPPAKRPMGGDIIESPHETEARHGIKRGQAWTGYKVQVTETCDDDLPHLITDIKITGALDNDSPQLDDIQRRLLEQETPPGEQYVDKGYMSGANLAASQERGITLMGKPLADTQGPEHFKQADFHRDEEARIAICPAGEQSNVWAQRKDPKGGPPSTLIRFPAKTCQACRFFGQCTKSKQGRSLTVGPHLDRLEAQRMLASTEAYQEKLHRRSGIEGAISELVRGHGMRHARYRGQRKIQLQAYFTAVATNLKRSIRWLTDDENKNEITNHLLPTLSYC